VREDGLMVGSRQLHNRTLWICLAALFALQVIAVQVGVAGGFHYRAPEQSR
jgi:Ca2+-transporting ATPase